MADTMRSVLPKRRRSMGGPRALRHDSRAAADLRSLLGRRRDLNAFKTRPRAQVGPANGRYRRCAANAAVTEQRHDCRRIAVIGQTSLARLPTTLSGYEQPVQVIPEAEVPGGPSSAARSLSGDPIVKHHDTDVGFLYPLPLPVFLEEDKGPH